MDDFALVIFSHNSGSPRVDTMASQTKMKNGTFFNDKGGFVNCFSSRAPLLEVIYQLHSFSAKELLNEVRQNETEAVNEENVIDYLNQLTQINILRQNGERFVVQPFLKQ